MPCNKNVVCPEGAGWEQEIKSVALILTYNYQHSLAGWCTGSLINNTKEDGRPLFLTARHCMDDEEYIYNFTTWVFLFNHQSKQCDSDGSEIYAGNDFIYGANDVIGDLQGSPRTDFLILELSTTKEFLASFGVCYSGWSLTTSPQGPFVSMHHPRGDIKKIAKSNGPIKSTDYGDETVHSLADYWMLKWDIGTTEPGSSGAPLFDKDHRIIGQLRGGISGCNGANSNGYNDWYGKLYMSWENNLTRVRGCLDPDNTGKTFVDTYCLTQSGGGGGGGNHSNICYSYQCEHSLKRDGFIINGQDNGVVEVCLEDNIFVQPGEIKVDVCHECEPTFRLGSNKVKIKCKNESEYHFQCYPYNSLFNLFETKCYCLYFFIFISITEVNSELTPVGNEYAEWQYSKRSKSPEKGFSLFDYLPQDIQLENNKYYKLKIAENGYRGSHWNEATRYFHTFSNNTTINGSNPVDNVYGGNITFQNTSITKPIAGIANTSIQILPSSQIHTGIYMIDKTINCNSFAYIAPQQSGPVNDHDNYYSQNENPELFENDILSLENNNKNDNSCTIYPNPTTGMVTIQTGNTVSNGEIIVTNPIGAIVKTQIIHNTPIQLDLSDFTNGIYQITIKTETKIITGKIIKQ